MGWKIPVKLNCFACLYLTLSLLLFPIKWVLAWYIAAGVHELFHLIAIHSFCVPLKGVEIKSSGLIICAEFDSNRIEFLCTIAGPLGSLMLLLFIKFWPELGICALIQLCYNLFPVYPLDGGRALRCLFVGMFSYDNGCKLSEVLSWICTFVILLFSVYLTFARFCGIIPIILGISFVLNRVKEKNLAKADTKGYNGCTILQEVLK